MTARTTHVEYRTPNGKEIDIKIAPNTFMWKIEFKSGGQTPKEFDSLFTSSQEAINVIEKYLEKKQPKNA